jgi:hypothetical protein
MIRRIVLAAAIALSQVACGEKPQTVTARKADTKVWASTENAFAVPGWKTGDQASWEEQIRNRAQAQNDYARAK